MLLTNADEPVVRLDLLKGKSRTPETVDLPMNDIIDVKGMKAQGNRLSPHTVTKMDLVSLEKQPAHTGESVADDPEDANPDDGGQISLF